MAMPLTLGLKAAHKALPESVYTRTDDGFVATFEINNWPGLVVQHVRSAIVNDNGKCSLAERFTEVFTDLPGRDYSADHFVVPKSWTGDTGGALAFSGTAWAVLQDRDAMTHHDDKSVITSFAAHQDRREEILHAVNLARGTVGKDPWGTAFGLKGELSPGVLGEPVSAPFARRAIVVWDNQGRTKLFAEHGAAAETDPLGLKGWEAHFGSSANGEKPRGAGKAKAVSFDNMTTLAQATAYFTGLMGDAEVTPVGSGDDSSQSSWDGSE